MLPCGFKIELCGLVQGVGFRPFVYNLAKKHKLNGEVYNDSKGVVIILACEEKELELFIKDLRNDKPKLARIDKLEFTRLENLDYKDFKITPSKINLKTSAILSDYALCKDCKQEFYDSTNPRFKYPFITCTHCGVRFSIIKSLPYDRANTSMSAFNMCEFCEQEYQNPSNRRFHAQPLSCPKCKISIYLKDKAKKVLCKDKHAIRSCAKALKDGKILAIKGIGGFHLVCDALNKEAIKELRLRKKRAKKPLAIMCKNLDEALKLAFIDEDEAKLLSSKEAPIVLLKAKQCLEQIAFESDKIGIMLAYTPLHLLLFEYFHNPIVATSANISTESILYKEDDLLAKLGDVFDLYLDYDREIINPSDDSIAQIFDKKPMYLRTSRGKRPQYIKLDKEFKTANALALGSELKNEFVIAYDDKLLLSPYLGDMKSLAVQERMKILLDFFKKTYDLSFDFILADKHPHFAYAKNFKPNLFMQHHYAHLCAVLFEHKIYDTVLAFCFDGTGYGDDKKIWGGEILKASLKEYERVGHFTEFKIINADIKNIQNLALALIFKWNLQDETACFLQKIEAKKLRNLEKIYRLSSLYTTSLGRIIDAFGSIAFDIDVLDFEAQIGLLMENYYDINLNYSYEFEIKSGEICFKNAFKAALKDDKRHVSTGLLNAIANLIITYSAQHKHTQNKDIVLCGGVFQNKTLLNILKSKNFSFKTGFEFPVNDGSIALGQMAHFLYKLNDT